MDFDLSILHYNFASKPLLIGGKAMEYYDLRKAGDDIDFVISKKDYKELSLLYPYQTKDLYGDLGVIVEPFELWTSICLFMYEDLISNAKETDKILIIALDKLLLLKSLGMEEDKYAKDVRLIGGKLKALQYSKS